MLHSRMKRINAMLRNEISEILLNDMKDPRLGFVTVVQVNTSKDLHTAVVFVSTLSDEEGAGEEVLEALDKARGYIKSLLAQRVILKFMPDLKFRLHEGARHAAEIDRILKDLSPHEDANEEKGD